MERPITLFLRCKRIAVKVRGAGEVKHRELFRESYTLGYISFLIGRSSGTKSGHDPMKQPLISEKWNVSLCLYRLGLNPGKPVQSI